MIIKDDMSYGDIFPFSVSIPNKSQKKRKMTSARILNLMKDS